MLILKYTFLCTITLYIVFILFHNYLFSTRSGKSVYIYVFILFHNYLFSTGSGKSNFSKHMLNWVLLIRSLVTLKLISLNLCTIKLRFNFKIYMFAHKIELQMVTKRMKINKHIFYKLIFIFYQNKKNWINNYYGRVGLSWIHYITRVVYAEKFIMQIIGFGLENLIIWPDPTQPSNTCSY